MYFVGRIDVGELQFSFRGPHGRRGLAYERYGGTHRYSRSMFLPPSNTGIEEISPKKISTVIDRARV